MASDTGSRTRTRFRHRLRSRIVIAFVVFGTLLTTAFALATLYLRDRLENELIIENLQAEVDSFVAFKRQNPEPDAQFMFERFSAAIYGAHRFANIPLEWQELDTGVHDLTERTVDGTTRHYKLAVRADADMRAFLRYDVTQEELGKRQMIGALGLALAGFTAVALLVGLWSSRRVMKPVTDLAQRVEDFVGRSDPQPLAPHFADDEVGQLAAALDGYAGRLTELVRRDREFNADVSHELRTPLAVIKGAAELILAGELQPKLRERVQRIERAARQCTDLISALLMLSRNERNVGAGERTDIARLCAQLIQDNRHTLAGKPIDIRLEALAEPRVLAPESVFAVALGNLVSNACKYTREGEIVVRVLDDRVEVVDTGPGLSEEDAAHAFDRGYRGTAATGTGGGIGLAIVGRLSQLYGWRVSLVPRRPHGATATLVFGR
ncbi:MAG: HAMP domain-containing histidine kinase [Xanthomonadales bacterium]|nr:HAMP domain-containing histidine kinase [Xanthomonadales bacterium]